MIQIIILNIIIVLLNQAKLIYKMIIFKLDDKLYKTYKNLFTLLCNKFNLINNYILYNIHIGEKKICNIDLIYSKKEQSYYNIILKNNNLNITGFNFQNFIPIYTNNKDYLVITNLPSLIINNYNNNKNIDILFYYDPNNKGKILNVDKFKQLKIEKNIISNLDIYLEKILYLQFLNNLKNVMNIKKYKLISCHYAYILGLSLSASYKMLLEIPNIISTIAMAFKYIENNGTLLLFFTIINVNIPVVKQILSLLSYGFKTVEIIDNNINQNILIGVPEYYIKCTGFKDNIKDELINKLIDIAINTVDYTYETCEVLDYYDDYTMKKPNHSLFYNKKDDKQDKLEKKNNKTSSLSSTKKSSSSTKKAKLPVKQIYYIEDLELSEIDTIMKDKTIEFKVSNLTNKLETIFVSYFEMVNNLILNSIAKDKNGKLYVKPSAILQKDITNLTKLINMFEYNKLPYNKHALQVVLNKKDEVLEQFYSLDTQLNYILIHYNDKTSKTYNKHALENIKSKSLQPYKYNILAEYYERINSANKVKQYLLDDLNAKYENKIDDDNEHENKINIKHILYKFDYLFGFSKNLCHYINDNNVNNINSLPIYVGNSFLKLWEILSSFNIIPCSSKTFKVFHLAEPTGQMIICAKHWAERKCSSLDMKNYDWVANTFNPYNTNITNSNITNSSIDNSQGDEYELIKNYYNRWLWGADNSGDITNSDNIKSIMNDIKNKWLSKNNSKLDLIISDGSILPNNTDELFRQKFELAKVISVLACSSIGGSCCIKHYIPYKIVYNYNTKDNTTTNPTDILESSGFFINYLYLYYVVFDSIRLFKPHTSNADTTEFYIIGKGFTGIENSQLEKLFKLLDNFELNGNLIEHNKIPETFIMQINNFLKSMSDTNILSIEKQNLLLTCYKNESDEKHNSESECKIDSDSDSKIKSKCQSKKYKQTNKILRCDKFLNPKNIKNIVESKYKEWVKTFDFE